MCKYIGQGYLQWWEAERSKKKGKEKGKSEEEKENVKMYFEETIYTDLKNWEVLWDRNENEKYQSLKKKKRNYTALEKEGNIKTYKRASSKESGSYDNRVMQVT